MKRSWIVTILVCIVLLGGGAAVLLLPQVVPFRQCSEIYQKYAEVDGVDATFVKDYKVNDSVFVNVTVLQAKDSAGWALLCKDFDVPTPSHQTQSHIDDGVDLITTRLIVRDTTDTSYKYKSDILGISHLSHTITAFHTKSKSDAWSVMNYNFDKSTQQ